MAEYIPQFFLRPLLLLLSWGTNHFFWGHNWYKGPSRDEWFVQEQN